MTPALWAAAALAAFGVWWFWPSSASASPGPSEEATSNDSDATVGADAVVLAYADIGNDPWDFTLGAGGQGMRLDPSSSGSDAAPVSPATPLGGSSVLAGAAGRLSAADQQTIVQVARAHGVDPLALAAIRLQENGGPGREFGVLPEGLTSMQLAAYRARVQQVGSFQAQAEEAAVSLRKAEERYRDATGQSPKDASGRYVPAFWTFFGARWAPVDAANDPRGLNRYWVTNVISFYEGSMLG